MANQTAKSATELDISTILAYDRTRLAYENTMMSWVRTATSLITFGFSVYKFFQIERGGGEQVDRLVGPR
jgi:putative membrane protein